MMETPISCPECGAKLLPEVVRCTECHAFVNDISPWRSDHNLLMVPITLVVWFFLYLLLRVPSMPTSQLFNNVFCQIILAVGIYGVLVILGKLAVTRRQWRAFRVVREACARHQGDDWNALLRQVRRDLDAADLGSFNTLLAYSRLQWLATSADTPRGNRATFVNSLHQYSATDWEALESSLATTQYVIWLLPTMGFLGTVWGMTMALAAFAKAVESPAGDISFKAALAATAHGLGVAFYTTLVGLVVVIPVLFLATLARRRAQSVLEQLDKFFIRVSARLLSDATPADPQAAAAAAVPAPTPAAAPAATTATPTVNPTPEASPHAADAPQ